MKEEQIIQWLKYVLANTPNCLANKRQLSASLKDGIPLEIVNTLMLVYEEGIVHQMINMREVDEMTVERWMIQINRKYHIYEWAAKLYLDYWAKALNKYNSIQKENLFEYIENDNMIEITKYLSKDFSSLKIPEVIDGKRVWRIGDNVFEYHLELESVYLPSSICEIGNRAFEGCQNLSFLILPEQLVIIENYAFRDCGFKNIELPNKLRILGKGCFENCRLEEISLPDGIALIPEHAFYGCLELTTVKFPSGLKEIDKEAFLLCEALSELNLPKGLLTIGDGAFSLCSSLKKVMFPKTLKNIGELPFGYHGFKNIQYYTPSYVWEWLNKLELNQKGMTLIAGKELYNNVKNTFKQGIYKLKIEELYNNLDYSFKNNSIDYILYLLKENDIAINEKVQIFINSIFGTDYKEEDIHIIKEMQEKNFNVHFLEMANVLDYVLKEDISYMAVIFYFYKEIANIFIENVVNTSIEKAITKQRLASLMESKKDEYYLSYEIPKYLRK